jgi:hypothetical protein
MTNMKQGYDPKNPGAYAGAAWMHPGTKDIYAGRTIDEGPYIATLGKKYQAGIVTDVSAIEATAVMTQLLGLAEKLYKLDACLTVQPAPQLVLDIDADAMGYGQENVGPLEESEIVSETFTDKHFECVLNEVHVVVEDRAAMKARHDLMAFKIAKAAKRLARYRNRQIATALTGATDIATAAEWDDVTAGVSDHNPMDAITGAFTTIENLGYPAEFMAVNGSDWSHFLANTHIAPMAVAGMLSIGPNGGSLRVPGWPNVTVIVDGDITAGHCFIGNREATVLAEGPTETVKYRHELKRYTGYVARQYIQPQVVITDGIRELTGIV